MRNPAPSPGYGITYAVVDNISGDNLALITKFLRSTDEILIVRSGETAFSDHHSPQWMHRAINPWGLLIYPYETLDHYALEMLQGVRDFQPARFTINVELPDGDGGPLTRPEVRVFHREAVGDPMGSLADCSLDLEPMTNMKAREALHLRLCAGLEWLDQDPENPHAWLHAANLYLALGEDARAESCGRQALVRSFHHTAQDAVQLTAHAMVRGGRAAEAVRLCATEHLLGNYTASSMLALAQAHLNLGNYEFARLAASQSAEMPWDPRTCVSKRHEFERHALVAQIELRCDQPEQALDTLANAPEATLTTSLGATTAAAALAQLGYFEEALGVLTDSMNWDSLGASAISLVADLQSKLGQFEQSADLYQQAWDSGLKDSETFMKWLSASEQLGDATRIESAYKAYSEVNDVSAPVLLRWGQEFETMGDEDKAAQCYSEALKLDCGLVQGFFSLGRLLMRQERFSDAAHMLESGLQLSPADADAWQELSICCDNLGLHERQNEALENVRRLRPAAVVHQLFDQPHAA